MNYFTSLNTSTCSIFNISTTISPSLPPQRWNIAATAAPPSLPVPINSVYFQESMNISALHNRRPCASTGFHEAYRNHKVCLEYMYTKRSSLSSLHLKRELCSKHVTAPNLSSKPESRQTTVQTPWARTSLRGTNCFIVHTSAIASHNMWQHTVMWVAEEGVSFTI